MNTISHHNQRLPQPIRMKENMSFSGEIDLHVAIHLLEEPSGQWLTRNTGPERISCYEIIWLQQGHCTFRVNDHLLQLTNATACLLVPGQIRHTLSAENIKGFRIILSRDYFYLTTAQSRNLFFDCNFTDRPWWRKMDKQRAVLLETLLSIFQAEYNNGILMRQSIILGWLKILLDYLDWGYVPGGSIPVIGRDREISQYFLKLIVSHHITHKRVADYARLLSITPTHLNQVVKRSSGYPASYHIQQYIVMEAKRQALDTGKSMKEIASALGFDDPAHFSKFFKKITGSNFTYYKRSMPAIA